MLELPPTYAGEVSEGRFWLVMTLVRGTILVSAFTNFTLTVASSEARVALVAKRVAMAV